MMRDICLKPVVWEWEDKNWLVRVHWTEHDGWEWQVVWIDEDEDGDYYDESGHATSYEDAERKALEAVKAIEKRLRTRTEGS